MLPLLKKWVNEEMRMMQNNDSHVKEGNKNFIFNSTGNIMIATTETDSSNMDESSRRVFNEVSVFFAAMTRAITNTPGQ